MERINGLSRKLHLYQIISYIFFLVIIVVYYFIVLPLSPNLSKIIGGILTGISIIFVIVSGYLATVTDPSDPYLQMARKARFEKQSYTPPEREFYCSSDHTYVKTTSKHCKRCNRCTEEFDHHCKWINNDVGKANYRSFFVMITSVMVLLTVYMVCSIIVTVNYAKDSQLLENDIVLYASHRDELVGPLAIMWIFMGLSLTFLVLDTNLVLFHIFLIYKGLTTFQYITAVEERKEYRKELEYAMKILGGRKKTCLDFVLCLKKRPNKGKTNNFAKPQDTPQGGEQDLPSMTPLEQNQLSDLLKKTMDKPVSELFTQNNADDAIASGMKIEGKENETESPELMKSEVKKKQIVADTENEKELRSQNHESGRDVQPLVMKIERDEDRRRTGNHRIHSMEDQQKTTAPGLTGEMSPDFKKEKKETENDEHKTPKKQSWQEHICLEIGQEHEDGDTKHKRTNNLPVHPRASTYSIEKEKPNAQTETYRSNHIQNLRGATKLNHDMESQRYDSNRKSIRGGLNDSNDIAVETCRASVASVV